MKDWKQIAFPPSIVLNLLFALILLNALPAMAQTTVAISSSHKAPIVIDWEEAWERAVESNETHRLALLEHERADLQVLEAWSYAMPTFDVNGMFNHYMLVPSMIVEFGGQSMAFKFSQDNTVSANAQITQPLWLAGKVGMGLRIAKNYRKIAEMGVDVSEQDLRVQLVEAFYGAMVADEYVEVTGDALDQAQRHLDQVQLMFREGVVSEYDRIRARVAVSNLRPDVIEAETARELAYKGLKNLLGMDLDTPIMLQGQISDIIQQPELGYADAADYATERRLELKQLDLQRKLYEDQKIIEQRNWLWPNFLAGLRWETQAQSNEFDFQDKQFYNGTSAQLMVNIPLFNGLASHRRSQIAEVNIRKVGLQATMLERGIRMQVFQATQNFDRASETLKASLDNRSEAEKGYSIAETRYAEGIGTQLEVLDAQLQLNMSKVNVLQAEYDQLVARAQYDRATGQVR